MSRIERDSLGEMQVPEEALWGAQTQRAVRHSHQRSALFSLLPGCTGCHQAIAAETNVQLGLLDAEIAKE